MSRKLDIFETVLEEPYQHDLFVDFTREFLNNVNLIAPNRFIPEYSNFSMYVGGYYHIGNYMSDEGDKVAIISVSLHKGDTVERARGIQRSFVKKLLDVNNCQVALVAFYTGHETDKIKPEEAVIKKDLEKWRLSFIRLDYEFSKGKVSEKLTPAKRYSYLVGKGEPCNTAKQRLFPIFRDDDNNPGLDDLEEAFSVEKVTNEFFQLYCEKFHELREYLESNDDFMQEAQLRNFTSEQFAKKLLGQIVFLYFIQKKGWLGVDAIPTKMTEKDYNKAYWARGEKSRDIVSRVYALQSDGTYRIVFEKLQQLSDEDEEFLAGIVKGKPWGTGPKDFMRKIFEGCKSAEKNYFDDYLEPLFYTGLNKNRGENGFFPPLHRRIPFLNGGLFEQLDNYEWENNNFNIPNSIFSNIDEKGVRDADGILDIFDRYNFTMNEDEPMEREVAIDPEMLGKVFENLLDVKDRKSKGAFYTPREIVHYMCQETLINYLVGKTGISENAIRDFIIYGEYMRDEDTMKTLKVTGDNGRTHYEIDKNKDMLISEEIFSLKKQINRLKELDELLSHVKVADLAVGSGAFPLGMLNEIVKAREVLTEYLAIEMNSFQKKSFYAYERKPYDLKVNTIKNCIFACDIEPSAVDIAKLRLWLSIVIDDEIAEDAGNGEFDAHTKPRQLPNLDCNIICGNSLVDEFMGNKLITESVLLNNVSENSQGSVFQSSIDGLISKLIELQDKLFFTKNHDDKEEIKEQIQQIYNDIILEQIGGDKQLKESYYETLTETSRPFILWQLVFPRVFKENGGFDIIIGNPPYIRERGNKEVFDSVIQTEFGRKYHQGKMDYWYYFLHRGIEYVREEGNICFITPRYWLNGAGATNLIKRIKEKLSFVDFVDIGKLKVFDNVVGYHMIALYQKGLVDSFSYKVLQNSLEDISKQVNTDNLAIVRKRTEDVITANYEITLADNEKKYDGCVLLGDVCDVSQGVVEASDRVSKRLFAKYPREEIPVGTGIFVLNEEELNRVNPSEKEKKYVRKYIDGNDLSRYKIEFSNHYLIYSNKECREKIEKGEYSNLKKHLDRMQDYITSSNAPYGIHRPRKEIYFENPKIIVPSMFAVNNFALDIYEHYYVGMSFSCVIQKDTNYELEYILAILNSRFAYEWFYNNGKLRGAGVDIGVDKLRTVPIRIAKKNKQLEIVEMVRQLETGYNKELDDKLNQLIDELYERRIANE